MSRNASVGDVAGDYDEEDAYLLAPAATITVAMAATATDASAHWRGWGGHGSGCGLASNFSDGPAIMSKNTLGGGMWVRVRDMYGAAVDGYATAPPWYLLPGKTKSFLMNTKLKQICKNASSWVYTRLLLTVDPFNF